MIDRCSDLTVAAVNNLANSLEILNSIENIDIDFTE